MILRLSICGGTDGNRTSDTRIFSPLLYQLSYGTSVLTTLNHSICGCKNTTNFHTDKKKPAKKLNFFFLKMFLAENQIFINLPQ